MIELFVKEGLKSLRRFVKHLPYYMVHTLLHLLDEQNSETIYVAKNKSPLLVGLGDDFNVVA